MEMFKLWKRFEQDEDGAVTVDWVVLTAAVVGLGIAVLNAVGKSSMTLTKKISDELASSSVTKYTVN